MGFLGPYSLRIDTEASSWASVVSTNAIVEIDVPCTHLQKESRYDVLRLRGGGDTVSSPAQGVSSLLPQNSDGASGAMEIDKVSNKRVPEPPPAEPALNKRTPVQAPPDRCMLQEFNDLAGWIDQTVTLERSEKLTVAAAEGLTVRMKEIKDIFSKLCLENSRLKGINQDAQNDVKSILSDFTAKLTAKNEEIYLLREQLAVQNALPVARNAKKLFAEVASSLKPSQGVVQETAKTTKATVPAKQKNVTQAKIKQSRKDTLQRDKEVKSGPLFVFTGSEQEIRDTRK